MQQVNQISEYKGIRVMRTTQTILEMVQTRGKNGQSLEKVYRLLYDQNLYLSAYGKLYANDGAMTQGVDADVTSNVTPERNGIQRNFGKHVSY